MVDAMAHRGPDDAGYLVFQTGRQHSRGVAYGQAFTDTAFRNVSPLLPPIDSAAGGEKLHEDTWDLFLGHRRLSIIDLSPRGHQPMCEKTQNIWLSYNGEIYNFRELREELADRGHNFSSGTDTEVVIHSYEEWGIDCVKRFNGMFAFALWDNRRKELHLVRDRYGIKPLYYMNDGQKLVFGSEIKSILAYLPQKPSVDLLALNEYFSFQNVFSDRTLFEGIRMLPPAHCMTVTVLPQHQMTSTSPHPPAVSVNQYWDFDFTRPSDEPEKELQEQLYELIRQAVERQCVSDVPVGSYLSGGMDSGTVTGLTANHFGRIATFTGGFDLSEAQGRELRFDERELAEKMASLFQTQHYECVLHAGDMSAVMDHLIWHLEDLRVGQCYPNYYLHQLASKFVKVSLSGAGGDELFGGYPWRYASAVAGCSGDYVQNYYRYWKRLVRNRNKPHLFSRDVAERLRKLDEQGAVPFRDHTLSMFKRVFGGDPEADSREEQVNHSLYFECKTFLHGLLMVDDKLSMAHGLESRVPLLDNDIVDLACRIPIRYKVADLENLPRIDENQLRKKKQRDREFHGGKSILRGAMSRILPEEICRARKQGFSAPDESWFRGQAEDFVRHELLSSSSRIRDYLDQDFVRSVLDEHSSGTRNRRLLIWSLLSFETWLRQFQ